MTTIDSMSDYLKNARRLFSPLVSIVPGVHARRLRVRATLDSAHGAATRAQEPGVPGPPPFEDDLKAFLAAVDVGCFTGRSQASSRILSQTEVVTNGVTHKTWEVEVAPLPEGAFGCLARMAGQAQHFDLAELAVEEVAPPEAPRVRGDALAPIASPQMPFTVMNHLRPEDEQKFLPVVVTFRGEVVPEVFADVEKLFRTWAAVLQSAGLFHALGNRTARVP